MSLKLTSRPIQVLTVAAALVSILVLAVVAQKASSGVVGLDAPDVSQAEEPQMPASEAHALLTAVHHYGFEPAEMNVEEGRYLVVVQNLSGLSNLVFRLDEENGRRVHEDRSQGRQWRKRFDLKKGNYRISVENHPEWSCLIRVQ